MNKVVEKESKFHGNELWNKKKQETGKWGKTVKIKV